MPDVDSSCDGTCPLKKSYNAPGRTEFIVARKLYVDPLEAIKFLESNHELKSNRRG